METDQTYALLRDPDMKEIFDSFVIETKEILDKLDLDLVELENHPNDSDLLNQIFRAFHTIKGTSGFLGLNKMTKLTHRCEDILNKLRKGEAQINDEIMNGILLSYDGLKELLSIIETKLNEDYELDETIILLEKIIASMGLQKIEASASCIDVNNDIHEPVQEAKLEENLQTDFHKDGISPIHEIEIKSETIQPDANQTKNQTTKQQTQSIAKKGDNTIRVDVERLDDLVNIVSELVLGRNRLMQVYADAAIQYEGTKLSKDLAETSRQIDLMTTELQLAVMKTRMIKIAKVFNKFPRLVRDMSKETGKDIELLISGEETELDKTLIEEINDPLVHLIRNSIDHGLETPEDRIKKGKPVKGTISLSAEHEGNNIIITIEDDGKGIDTEVIKEKAISKELISRERANDLTKQEVYNLLFLPGFSTAEKITNISGRGVGMDVVKTNVMKLRGIINIESVVDKGTKIIIKLPLTLAIIQGLLVNVSNETVIIPLNSVLEVVRVHQEQISTINKKEVIKLRDSVLPLINIDKLLYKVDNQDDDRIWQYVVVVGVAEKIFGIKVDSLLGQREVVIKSLGNYLGTIEGIAGSTIMGDGRVLVILDLAAILNHLRGE
jgi:two-component system chemotaxis sensor kinase CheA